MSDKGHYSAKKGYDKEQKLDCYFYKDDRSDKVWWVDYPDRIGDMAVSFDCEHILHLFGDYPDKFTAEEKALFDEENPYWADFFGG